MKKNIRLSELELVDLIRKVIYEQSTIATGTKIIQGPAGDPYEYKREGGKYYTRKKGSTNWILTKDQVANAIATKQRVKIDIFQRVNFLEQVFEFGNPTQCTIPATTRQRIKRHT